MTDKNKTDDAAEIEGEPIVGHTQEVLNHGIEEIADMGDYALDDAEKIALGILPFPGTGSDKD
jgi:hypothetical protein